MRRSIKIATTTQSITQALANLQRALPVVIESLKGGWENVQSLHLKTGDSVALPIWTCGLGLEGETTRWEGLVAGGESGEDDEDELDIDEVVKMKGTGKRKGTKRPSEEDVPEGKPKKKVKGTQPTPDASPAVVTVPMEVVPAESSAMAVDVPAKKKKRQIRKEHEAAVLGGTTPSHSVTTEVSAVASDVSVKKKKHVRQEAAPTAATAAIDVDANAAPSNSTPTVVPADLLADGRKKKKTSAKAGQESKANAPSSIEPAIIDASAIAEDASTKMRRKGKKAQIIQKETYPEPNLPTTSDGITKDELKQKRRGESGKKKKDKVLRKSGRSAKDAILGRKAAQA